MLIQTNSTLVKAERYQPRLIHCNAFDEVLREVPVAVAFYYKEAVNDAALKHALKVALEAFDLFSARLTYRDDSFCIDCDNQGVGFSRVNHTFPMSDVLKDQFNPIYSELLFEQINPKTVIKRKEAVLTARVNYFNDGSMCLGMVWHHAIGDMQTFMSFMNAWSNAFSGVTPNIPVQVDDRHKHMLNHLARNDNKDEAGVRKIGMLEGLKLLYYMKFKQNSQRWVQFYFSDQELKTMHSAYNKESGQFLTKNDVLSAHILSVFTKAIPQQGKIKGRALDMAINFRGRTKLDQAVTGNMVSTVKVNYEPSGSPMLLAQEIRRKVDHYAEKHLDYYATLDYIEKHGGRKKISQFVPDWLNPYGQSLLLTSWAKFGVYDLNFAGQTPCYFATMGPALFPWITSLYEGPNNQGLIYTASLPNEISDDMIRCQVLNQINQYRDPNEILPEFVLNLVMG